MEFKGEYSPLTGFVSVSSSHPWWPPCEFQESLRSQSSSIHSNCSSQSQWRLHFPGQILWTFATCMLQPIQPMTPLLCQNPKICINCSKVASVSDNTDLTVLVTHPGHDWGNVIRGELLKHLVREEPLGHPRGRHGHDHVGVDVVLGALLTQSVAQPNQPKFGRAVVRLKLEKVELFIHRVMCMFRY